MDNLTPYSVISKKRNGEKLTKEEIFWAIKGLSNGNMADYQMSALLMAMFIQGMDTKETAYLTDAMLLSGDSLNFDDPTVVDKHSTGGVGDKTSFIIAPIAAAAGIKVPMISGRGLGHTGGTTDKIEAIKGYSTELTLEEFSSLVTNKGIALMGQTENIAPADKKIYSLRDVTATVESIPLITASIMSKKLAEGISGLVMDVKWGSGAFMKTIKDARSLAKSISNTAKRFDKKCMALITNMSQPLGNAVGHSIELIECVEILKGNGPKDLLELSLELSGAMIYLGGQAKTHKAGIKKAKEVIKNGMALKKFEEMVINQGGDSSFIQNYDNLKLASEKLEVKAIKSGFITKIICDKVGLACGDLGGGRKKADDIIDMGVGFYFHKKINQRVKEGDSILTIYYNFQDKEKALEINKRFNEEIIKISPKKTKETELIYERITN